MKKAIMLISASIVLVFLSGAVLSHAISNNDKIHKNVYVEEVDVGNMTKEEAIKELIEKYKVPTIGFVTDDKRWDLNLKDIGFKYKVEESVDKAFEIGKNGNFIENVTTLIDLNRGSKKVIKLDKEYNKKDLEDYITKLSEDINVDPIDASIKISYGNINISNEQVGYHVDVEELNKLTADAFKQSNFSDIKIPIKQDEPKIKREYLTKVNYLLGEYSTKFNASVPGRSENIRLCANQINGKLLMPGEEFSFNDATGRRGLEQGYQKAPVIVQGELQEGIAGGVCQVSSTLFNSVLYSGLDITSRRNHSIPSSYVEKGRDATVDYGNIDFKFKNNYQNPVYVESYVSGNVIVTRIHGNNADKKNVTINTVLTQTIPREVVTQNDSTVAKGKQVVKENGRDGFRVETYRTIDGTKNLVTKSYYPAKRKLVLNGTNQGTTPVVQPVTINNAQTAN